MQKTDGCDADQPCAGACAGAADVALQPMNWSAREMVDLSSRRSTNMTNLACSPQN